MKIYFAGNLRGEKSELTDDDSELECVGLAKKNSFEGVYNRLQSFFFRNKIDSILRVVRKKRFRRIR